jgi:hypothetical protein
MALSVRSTVLALTAPFLLSMAASACAADTAADAEAEASDQDLTARRPFYVSATTVARLDGSLDRVTPPVRTADPAHMPDFYLQPSSALGPTGPISAWGPLGALGPVGDNAWNPSQYVDLVPNWKLTSAEWWPAGDDKTARCVRSKPNDGPLSEAGPLGPCGPLSKEAYEQTLPGINDFSKQLQAGGVWTVLGPLGPLGPLGVLGPLGPLLGKQFRGSEPDADGNYKDARGNIVRTVDVPYEGGKRTYELLEKYTESAAKRLTNNDTSFMVMGSLDSPTEQDEFTFTSREDQFVTVTLVPENALSDFDFEITDANGRTIVKSAEDGRQEMFFAAITRAGSYIDFAQIKVATNEKLKARVTAKAVNGAFPTYRLIVVGSTKTFASTDIKGPHQVDR